MKAAKPGEPLLGMAMLSMAYIQELKGSYEAAAAEFEAIAHFRRFPPVSAPKPAPMPDGSTSSSRS